MEETLNPITNAKLAYLCLDWYRIQGETISHLAMIEKLIDYHYERTKRLDPSHEGNLPDAARLA